MGKLNIAHHKSYHPYRRDNIERVRRDEENARREEEEGEQRVLVADAEARIEMLRRRAGVNGSGAERNGVEDREEVPATGPSSLAAPSSSSGHINLFEDLEKQNMAIMIKTTSKKSGKDAEAEKGIPLAPSAKDRTPWYSAREGEKGKEVREDVRLRDIARKSRHDPLTQITHQLAQRPSSSSSSQRPQSSFRRQPPVPSNSKPEVAERLTRESSERQRALELIRRRKLADRGSATPSTVRGGREEGYGDQYNWREVEEAHRGRAGGSAGARREERWRR